MKHIITIGLGLIGGSLSLDLKQLFPTVKIGGIDKNETHISEALESQLIDYKAELHDLCNADLVIIATPVDHITNLLKSSLDQINDNCLVIDMGSIKSKICESISNHPRRRNFLACHPIAGTEFSGPKAALKGLFKNKTMIVCEIEKTAFKLQEQALEIFKKLDMRLRYMDPIAHDKHIAYVSHLSHISSFMLGKTVLEKEKDERDIFDLAGSGFESTVRLAKSAPSMWTPIFKENKENILETLNEYIQNLKDFKNLIQGDDYDSVFKEIKNTNQLRKILNGLS
jgi:prephenate dehydrogenase